MEKINGESKDGPSGGSSKSSSMENDDGGRTYLPWRFEDPKMRKPKRSRRAP